jgi:AraC-like DNA-binding protein
MDPLACLLDGPRARGAFVLRSSLTPPWSILIEDEAPMTLVAVLRGTAWVRPADGPPRQLRTGDVVVIRGPDPYTVSDEPARPPQVVIDVRQVCRPAAGQTRNPMGPQGTRSWGNSPDGETLLLTGTYRTHPELSRPLLAALPPVLVQAGPEWTNPLIGYLTRETGQDEPGQDAVLDRLLDLVLIAVLRTWFARPDSGAPGWYRAHRDPVVGQVLGLIHDQPEQPWTVTTLAAGAGISRASLARRFHDLVGDTPIGYLTGWRLTLAADLLTETDQTLEAVARRVGYGSAFALSTAFKRARGVSPREHRRAATARPAAS